MGRPTALPYFQPRVGAGCSATWGKGNWFPFPWVAKQWTPRICAIDFDDANPNSPDQDRQGQGQRLGSSPRVGYWLHPIHRPTHLPFPATFPYSASPTPHLARLTWSSQGPVIGTECVCTLADPPQKPLQTHFMTHLHEGLEHSGLHSLGHWFWAGLDLANPSESEQAAPDP